MFGMIGNETFIVLIDFNDISNHETRMLDMYIYIMIFQDEGQCVFSLPGPKGHVSFCHHFASVSVNFSYFHLLLWNHWTDLDQTWQKCSLGGLPSDLLFWCRSEIQLWKSSCHKIPSRWNCNIIEMMSMWSSTLYQVCYFCAECISKMAAMTWLSLTLDPMGISHFHLFFWNHKTDLNQTWQKCSLDGHITNFYTPTRREGVILQTPCPSVCPSVHTSVKDVSAATGRNDFIFDTWLWHIDLQTFLRGLIYVRWVIQAHLSL